MKRVFVLFVIAAIILPQTLYAKGFSFRSRTPGRALFRSSMPPKVTPNLASPMRKAPTTSARPLSPQPGAAGSSPSASSSPQAQGTAGSSLKNAIAPALIGAGAGYVASSLVNSHANAAVTQSQPNRLAAESIIKNAVLLDSPVQLEGEMCTKKALTQKGDVVYLNNMNEICGVFATPVSQ